MVDFNWLVPALILNTFAMTLVFVLSWLVLRRHPLPFFAPWVRSEGWRLFASVMGTLYTDYARIPVVSALSILGMLLGTLYLAESGRAYRGWEARWRLGRWATGAFAALSLVLVAGLQEMPQIFYLPAFLALGASQLWAGWVFWPRQAAMPGIGARVVGAGSILWGVQSLVFPVMIGAQPQSLVLSTILTALFTITVGMGMIVHLLEESNAREQHAALRMRLVNEELVGALNALSASRSEAQLYTEVAREQEALVRQIVHDLRNSSQAMSLIIEAMEDEAQGHPRILGYLGALDRQVTFISTFLKQKLAWIVDRQPSSPATSEARLVLQSLESTFAPIFAAKGQRLEVTDEVAACPIGISPVELEQLLGNLLSNANTHCPPNTCARLWAAASDGWITFYVVDDGPGIPLERQGLIGRMPRRADGTGVGLRNVADLVKGAGGSFGLSSESGSGCTFHVTLPLLSWGQGEGGEAQRQEISPLPRRGEGK